MHDYNFTMNTILSIPYTPNTTDFYNKGRIIDIVSSKGIKKSEIILKIT